MNEFERQRMLGQRAMSEEEMKAAAIRDLRRTAGYRPTHEDYERMRNSNPYRVVDGEKEPAPAPMTRWRRFKRWLFGDQRGDHP